MVNCFIAGSNSHELFSHNNTKRETVFEILWTLFLIGVGLELVLILRLFDTILIPLGDWFRRLTQIQFYIKLWTGGYNKIDQDTLKNLTGWKTQLTAKGDKRTIAEEHMLYGVNIILKRIEQKRAVIINNK